jgi:hypothetical protein
MVVIEIVKGAQMLDWHSEYLVIRARQRDIAAAADFGRLLAAARGKPVPDGRGRERDSARRPGPSLRYRVGAALLLLGHRLQGDSSEIVLTSFRVSDNLP